MRSMQCEIMLLAEIAIKNTGVCEWAGTVQTWGVNLTVSQQILRIAQTA